VGTTDGLFEIGDRPVPVVAGPPVTALARVQEGGDRWALLDGNALWRRNGTGGWQLAADVAPWRATCLAVDGGAVLVGTSEAHLLRVDDLGSGHVVDDLSGFDQVEDRDSWYTPWGGPPDTRSIAVSHGALYANVHVGGIPRSRDEGATWEPTIDIEADVHEVLAVAGSSQVLAAGAFGLSVSDDGGTTWTLETDGLHARYLRAVAVAGDVAVVSASTGPGGGQAAVYRRPLDGGPFERCRQGLPEWFSGNIDTGCLDARGERVVLGAPDGSVFGSEDGGRSWTLLASGLPPVTCVGI
jgi:hypothetical protein